MSQQKHRLESAEYQVGQDAKKLGKLGQKLGELEVTGDNSSEDFAHREQVKGQLEATKRRIQYAGI